MKPLPRKEEDRLLLKMEQLTDEEIKAEREIIEKEEWRERIMERRRWHMAKEIPIPFIFAVIMQSAALVWWARGLTSEVANLTMQLKDQKEERYTKDDARRDRDWLNLLIQGSRERETEVLRRIANLENDILLAKQRTIK